MRLPGIVVTIVVGMVAAGGPWPAIGQPARGPLAAVGARPSHSLEERVAQLEALLAALQGELAHLREGVRTGCAADAVLAGTVCVDKYEASVWQTTDAALIAKIREGTVTLADLTAAGAIQKALALGDLAAVGCPPQGAGCADLYAVSIPGVPPARFVSQFQALAVLRNAGKRLPTNAEWQAAALGTPDTFPGGSCLLDGSPLRDTGANAGCVSDVGAFDMVGNLWEWTADWAPFGDASPGWGAFSDDTMDYAGANPLLGPGTLARGGGRTSGSNGGPFAVYTEQSPNTSAGDTGFRGAR